MFEPCDPYDLQSLSRLLEHAPRFFHCLSLSNLYPQNAPTPEKYSNPQTVEKAISTATHPSLVLRSCAATYFFLDATTISMILSTTLGSESYIHG